jgi:exosortase A
MAVLIGLCFVLFRQTWMQMIHVWNNSETFSHAWLIAPISIWLIWQRRSLIAAIDFRPSWIGAVFLVGAGALWVLGQLAGVKVIEQFAVVGVLIGIVVLILGRTFFKEFCFPLVFLFFMVPAGEGLTPFLMQHTADATVWALRLSNIAVFREGMHFTLPTGRWSVVEACSGLRYVIAAGVLGVLFSYLNFETLRKRVVFVVACLLIAVFANWVRAYVVVLAGHFSGMRIGTGEDHVWFGWFFFGLVMALVFYIGMRYSSPPKEHSFKGRPPAAIASPYVYTKQNTWSLLVLYTLIGMGTLGLTRYLPPILLPHSISPSVPILLGNFSNEFRSEPFIFKTGFKGSQSQLEGSFSDDLSISVSQFSDQHISGDMLAGANRLIPESGSGAMELDLKPGAAAIALTVGSTKARLVRTVKGEYWVYHVYAVHGWTTSNEYVAKAFRLATVLLGWGDRSRSIAVASPTSSKLDVQRVRSIVYALSI